MPNSTSNPGAPPPVPSRQPSQSNLMSPQNYKSAAPPPPPSRSVPPPPPPARTTSHAMQASKSNYNSQVTNGNYAPYHEASKPYVSQTNGPAPPPPPPPPPESMSISAPPPPPPPPPMPIAEASAGDGHSSMAGGNIAPVEDERSELMKQIQQGVQLKVRLLHDEVFNSFYNF